MESCTLEQGYKEIDKYIQCIYTFLQSNKIEMKPRQYMATYTVIVRLCDEQDKACDIYLKYKDILDKYISKFVTPAIQNKLSDSRDFLEEYVS